MQSGRHIERGPLRCWTLSVSQYEMIYQGVLIEEDKPKEVQYMKGYNVLPAGKDIK